jgi:hypothetical protein
MSSVYIIMHRHKMACYGGDGMSLIFTAFMYIFSLH